MRTSALLAALLLGCGTVSNESPDAALVDAAPVDAAADDALADAAADASDDASTEPQPLTIATVAPGFLAHGARVVIAGTGFTGVTSLSIGGEALVPVSVTDTAIVVDPLPDTVGTGQVALLLQRTAESVTTTVAVGRLVINEIDVAPDTGEYIELVVGSPDGGTTTGLAVAGYTLVAFDHATSRSLGALAIDAVSSASQVIFARAPMAPNPLSAANTINYSTPFLPNSQAGLAIYQGAPGDFPLGTPATATGLIDAIVYKANDDVQFATPCVLLAALYGSRDTCVMDEDTGDDQNVQVVGRCGGLARRTSSTWRILTPTPGTANTCTNPRPYSCPSPSCATAR
jgi:adhesin/invasin